MRDASCEAGIAGTLDPEDDMQTAAPPLRTCTAEREDATDSAALMSIAEVAKLLNCSQRHVRRLANSGTMPQPVRLGTLIRWHAQTGDPVTGVRDWLLAGCSSCRHHAERQEASNV